MYELLLFFLGISPIAMAAGFLCLILCFVFANTNVKKPQRWKCSMVIVSGISAAILLIPFMLLYMIIL